MSESKSRFPCAAELAIFPEPFYRQLRSQPHYAGLPFITKGSMSVILEHPDGVLRLSRDGGTHLFLNEGTRRNLPGVARIQEDRGPVAPTESEMIHELDDYIWAAVIERLEPITEEDTAFDALKVLEHHLNDRLDGHLIGYQQALELMGIADTLSQELPPLRNALEALIELMDIIQQFRMDLDLAPSNFMRRNATGDIVLSDPIGSSIVMPSESQIARLQTVYSFAIRS